MILSEALGSALVERDAGLHADSHRAIIAFADKRPYEAGKGTLETDGRSLTQLGMGGQKLAVWRGDGKVVFVGDHSTRFQDQVIRALTKRLGKAKLDFAYNLRFEHGGDVNGDQWDGWIVAHVGTRVVGRLDWTEWRGEYSVKFVEVHPDFRRTGVATQLYRELFRKQGIRASDLKGSMQTPDGHAFRRGARF